jgi:hypothetical protein
MLRLYINPAGDPIGTGRNTMDQNNTLTVDVQQKQARDWGRR